MNCQLFFLCVSLNQFIRREDCLTVLGLFWIYQKRRLPYCFRFMFCVCRLCEESHSHCGQSCCKILSERNGPKGKGTNSAPSATLFCLWEAPLGRSCLEPEDTLCLQ